jgi:NAD(P)H dehydrogenase (quinone)
MTAVLGRRIRFHDETIAEAYESRASYGAPDWQVDAWVSTYTAIASGEVAGVTGDVEQLIGRPPMSLGQLLRAERPSLST